MNDQSELHSLPNGRVPLAIRRRWTDSTPEPEWAWLWFDHPVEAQGGIRQWTRLFKGHWIGDRRDVCQRRPDGRNEIGRELHVVLLTNDGGPLELQRAI